MAGVGILICACCGERSFAADPDPVWIVGAPVFRAGAAGTFDDMAVKDPSIVHFNGFYHVFYTSKQRLAGQKYRTALGYVSAPTLGALNDAPRRDMAEVLGMDLIAPQVFYFEPHRLWYLIAHAKVTGGRDLAPMFTTNPNLEDAGGWSAPRRLETGRTREEFWIDFWVICDASRAHLFYTNQKGEVLRIACPLETFPGGLATAPEEVALGPVTGEDETGAWRLFEAQHVYRVRNTGRYFMLVECAYQRRGAKNPYPLDSRNRFLIGFEADRLEGPWSRVDAGVPSYWATARDLRTADGRPSRYSLISHPEILRSGHEQRLEIDGLNAVQMMFQSFDATGIPDNYHYDALPWEWAVMRND